MDRVRYALAILLLCAGSAHAASTVTGELTLRGPIGWEGHARVTGATTTLALSAPEGMSLLTGGSWDSADGYLIDSHRRSVSLLVTDVRGAPEIRNDSIEIAGAEIVDARCDGRCEFFLYTLPGEPPPTLDVEGSGDLAWTALATAHWARNDQPGVRDAFLHVMPAGASAWRSLGAQAVPAFEGPVGLLLHGVELTIRSEGVTRTIRTGVTEESDPTAGAAGVTRLHTRFAVLRVDGLALQPAPRTSVVFEATEPRLGLAGEITAPDARGMVRVGAQGTRYAGDAMTIRGDLLLAPRLASDGAVTTTIAGDAARILLDGHVVRDGTPTRVGLLVAAAALAAWFARELPPRALAAVLYARLARGRILDHAGRRDLHEAIASTPGASISRLCRLVGMPRPVARYHLAIMERAGFVRSLEHGRERIYWTAGHRQRAEAEAVLCVEARRAVAEAVAREAGHATQASVSSSTGLSRRLVSHHLRRLERVGLVRRGPGRPQRYSATPPDPAEPPPRP